jgi:hypothetical protein
MADIESIFATCVPLAEIAQRLGVGKAQFYQWVSSNGFEVTRLRGNVAAVRKEVEQAIMIEARRQGFENPDIKIPEPEPILEIPTGSDEKGTIAYRKAYPIFDPLVVPRWSKAKPSDELGFTGDMQPLPP